MSAPNQSRQSPPPEEQSEKQVGAPASGKADAAPSADSSKKSSDQTKLEGLESNPKGPLEDKAKEKVTKDGRGDV
ncbi:MAG: hypothetical protein M1814_000244 [Vezdaea aestivalis]|nr:MAG: hypothetical protein M1814_000244 [Vezdaea aestivalis]